MSTTALREFEVDGNLIQYQKVMVKDRLGLLIRWNGNEYVMVPLKRKNWIKVNEKTVRLPLTYDLLNQILAYPEFDRYSDIVVFGLADECNFIVSRC